MTPQQKTARKKRVATLIAELKRLFPDSGMMLTYGNNWELLVAVMLSAQCTDEMVNRVTRALFAKYPTLASYCAADSKEFEQDIYSTGFYRNKAKNILAAAHMVRDTYNGTIPNTMEDMLQLPGVARKTANVVLGNAFGVVEGIAVDTHVSRFARRFDLTDHTTPDKIEQDLMEIIPKEDWFRFTYLAIEYGRHIAPARRYDTTQDPLVALYPPAGKIFR